MKTLPAKPPAIKTVRWIDRLTNGRQVGTIRISVGDRSEDYLIKRVPCEVGGQAFAVRKVAHDGQVYWVRIDVGQHSCSCPGFCWKGRCKHVSAVNALCCHP